MLNNFNDIIVECENPNANIYSFNGTLKRENIEDYDLNIPLDIDKMLLRGSSLRNTEWIYGIAVFTGHDTKVMMNSTRSKAKTSKMERATNRYIIIAVCIQFAICMYAAIYTSIW